MMTIAFLATGDELVHGDTVNTNTSQMAKALQSEGLDIGLHVMCQDDELKLAKSLDYLIKDHDVIIITGGLGPTTDDITRYALARHLNLPLVLFEDVLLHVAKRLKHVNVAMHEGNRQQALFPESARILPNPNGSACGCALSINQKHYYMLPGPPRECLPMFFADVMPELTRQQKSEYAQLKWLLFGVAESEIAEQLEAALAPLGVKTGYRLDPPYVEFKVRCLPCEIDAVNQAIVPIISPHLFADGQQKASSMLLDAMLKSDIRVLIEDSATEGHLQQTLAHPALKSRIDFFNQQKNYDYTFTFNGLIEYWSKLSASQTTLTIKEEKTQIFIENTLPYRKSPLCIPMATEWFCWEFKKIVDKI